MGAVIGFVKDRTKAHTRGAYRIYLGIMGLIEALFWKSPQTGGYLGATGVR